MDNKEGLFNEGAEAQDPEGGAVSEKERKLEELLTNVEKNTESNMALRKIMADPDVLKVLQAKQSGMKVNVDLGERTEPKEVSSEDFLGSVDFDSMSNKELALTIVKALKSEMGSFLQGEFSPLKDKVLQTDSYVRNKLQTEVISSIAEMKKKYNDFDKYRMKMQELLPSFPNASVEHLYFLAKLDSGERDLNPPKFESERPVSFGSRPHKGPEKSIAPGRAGFVSFLGQALASGTNGLDDLEA
jgi:hypothetical protein